jgi:NADH oxidase (H2O2-forming)
LPFAIAGKVPRVKDLIVYPHSLYRMSDIELHLETTVEKILPKKKKVLTSKGEFGYDSLIIASGSVPIIPSIPGVEKDRVYTLKGIEDGEKIISSLEDAKDVVVIGAGLIGLEMACAFRKRSFRPKVIEGENRILPSLLDEDMSKELKNHLVQGGIIFHLGSPAKEILGNKNVEGVLAGDEEIRADMVLLACGVKPDVHLAEEAGIELGNLGGIKVNERMQTSLDEIYAAGDCVESLHGLTAESISSMSMLGSTAVREGRVAGINAVGGSATLSPILNTTITELAGIEIGAVGLNSEVGLQSGFEVCSIRFEGSSLDPFFPGSEKIVIKMIGDRRSGKLIGAQIMGKERVWGRILAISFVMQKGITVEELAALETAYVPSISPTFDPITLAAEMLLRRMSQ